MLGWYEASPGLGDDAWGLQSDKLLQQQQHWRREKMQRSRTEALDQCKASKWWFSWRRCKLTEFSEGLCSSPCNPDETPVAQIQLTGNLGKREHFVPVVFPSQPTGPSPRFGPRLVWHFCVRRHMDEGLTGYSSCNCGRWNLFPSDGAVVQVFFVL